MSEPLSERDRLIEEAAALIPRSVWDYVLEVATIEDVVGPIVDGGWRPGSTGTSR